VTDADRAMFKHCNALNQSVYELLKDEATPIRVSILFSCLMSATQGVPPQVWVPILGVFLHSIGVRDGVHVCSVEPLGDDADAATEGETMH